METLIAVAIGAIIAAAMTKRKPRFDSHSPSNRPIAKTRSSAQRQRSERRISTTSTLNNQPLKKGKRIAIKKNGQYTFYKVNKYGEIFEETNE